MFVYTYIYVTIYASPLQDQPFRSSALNFLLPSPMYWFWGIEFREFRQYGEFGEFKEFTEFLKPIRGLGIEESREFRESISVC